MITLIKGKYYTFKVGFGKSKVGKDVQYQILNYDLTIEQDYTASGVMELGDGEYGVRLSFDEEFSGYIRWKDVTDNIVASDPITIIEDYVAKISTLYKIDTGRWKIQNNQMIFYDSDGLTELLKFNLKDENANPTMVKPFERTPV
jgi:hypothetical protein